MEHELLKQARGHMARTLDVLQGELAKIHTGRANPALVEGVVVDYYGTPTPSATSPTSWPQIRT